MSFTPVGSVGWVEYFGTNQQSTIDCRQQIIIIYYDEYRKAP